jgi:hypothetical protein
MRDVRVATTVLESNACHCDGGSWIMRSEVIWLSMSSELEVVFPQLRNFLASIILVRQVHFSEAAAYRTEKKTSPLYGEPLYVQELFSKATISTFSDSRLPPPHLRSTYLEGGAQGVQSQSISLALLAEAQSRHRLRQW